MKSIINLVISIILGVFVSILSQNIASAFAAERPVIGISGSAGDSKSVAAMMTMVRSLGATPVLLANHAQRISMSGGINQAVSHDLGMVDAVIVMGNNGDIDPASYGQPKNPATNIETDAARRDYENALIKEVISRKMPLLGVCGGHQRINVLTGGTLNQDVAGTVGNDHHMQGDIPGFIPVQYVGIVDGTTLNGVDAKLGGLYTPAHQPLPQGVVMENSFHHQAVSKVGAGLRVNAVSSDGIIEGIEADPNGPYRDQFLMGIQWHPEFGASELGPEIVKTLEAHASAYAKTHPKMEDVNQGMSFVENLTSSLNVIKSKDVNDASKGLTQGQGSMLDYVMQRRNQPRGGDLSVAP